MTTSTPAPWLRNQPFRKTMAKRLTGKREDSVLHIAMMRRGDFSAVKKIPSDHIESEETKRGVAINRTSSVRQLGSRVW
ncbi:hypothetical protein Bca4012_025519 [Brassica carinata]|uniref:Uncharacterized protein n=1 Tax=Brassica carinata TaxID=52824 RepID=A0A8X7VHE9_BRACI|nr:hypothetical protein Bca52824_022612 [Brassica carinata]